MFPSSFNSTCLRLIIKVSLSLFLMIMVIWVCMPQINTMSYWRGVSFDYRVSNGYCYDQVKDSGYSDYSASSLYNIDGCSFIRLSMYIGYGGVIYYDGVSTTRMQIVSSMFYNCSVNNVGGAIYYNGGDSYLVKVCVRGCFAQRYGHFGYLYALAGTKDNNLLFVSMVDCTYKSTTSDYGIRICKGYQKLMNSNLSMNIANMGSSLFFDSPTKIDSAYSTISNNYHSKDGGLIITGGSLYSNISYTNVVGNSCPSTAATIQSKGSTVFIVCSIFFENQGILLKGDGSLVVCDSFISHSSTLSISNVETTNCSSGLMASYFLTHYMTYHCPTYFPPSTPVKTFNPTVSATISMTLALTPELTLSNTLPMTMVPTQIPTISYTFAETFKETLEMTPEITSYPTISYSLNPTISDTLNPTISDTLNPTISDTLYPTISDTLNPTISDTLNPTISDTLNPTISDTLNPTISDTLNPTISDTLNPTISDTLNPTISDTLYPTISDTLVPTLEETIQPTIMETLSLTFEPTPHNTLNNERSTRSVITTFAVTIGSILVLFGIVYGLQHLKIEEMFSNDTFDSI